MLISSHTELPFLSLLYTEINVNRNVRNLLPQYSCVLMIRTLLKPSYCLESQKKNVTGNKVTAVLFGIYRDPYEFLRTE